MCFIAYRTPFAVKQRRRVATHWVPGHVSIPGNDVAHDLATAAVEMSESVQASALQDVLVYDGGVQVAPSTMSACLQDPPIAA